MGREGRRPRRPWAGATEQQPTGGVGSREPGVGRRTGPRDQGTKGPRDPGRIRIDGPGGSPSTATVGGGDGATANSQYPTANSQQAEWGVGRREWGEGGANIEHRTSNTEHRTCGARSLEHGARSEEQESNPVPSTQRPEASAQCLVPSAQSPAPRTLPRCHTATPPYGHTFGCPHSVDFLRPRDVGKHEILMTKSETSTKQETPMTETRACLRFGFSDLKFVSCFVLRFSCFPSPCWLRAPSRHVVIWR
jgi:hypothetical protein